MQTPSNFELGQVVMTHSVNALLESGAVSNNQLISFIRRHSTCDWGEICEHDAGMNQQALEEGYRLMSAYSINDQDKVWIITEAEVDGARECTTILLPEDY